MYRNLHFLVESATKVEVLYVSTLMLLFLFRQKVVAIFRRKKKKKKKKTKKIEVANLKFLLKINVILCTFLEKRTNNNTKSYKKCKITTKKKKYSFVKTL